MAVDQKATSASWGVGGGMAPLPSTPGSALDQKETSVYRKESGPPESILRQSIKRFGVKVCMVCGRPGALCVTQYLIAC